MPLAGDDIYDHSKLHVYTTAGPVSLICRHVVRIDDKLSPLTKKHYILMARILLVFR